MSLELLLLILWTVIAVGMIGVGVQSCGVGDLGFTVTGVGLVLFGIAILWFLYFTQFGVLAGLGTV